MDPNILFHLMEQYQILWVFLRISYNKILKYFSNIIF